MSPNETVVRWSGCCLLLAGLLFAASSADAQRRGRSTVKQDSSVIEIYGLVVGDLGHDFEANDPRWFDVNRPSKLPAFRDEFGFDHRTWGSARATMFGVKSATPTARGDVTTTLEFDLFGLGNHAGQAAFDVIHAYGEWRGFGAGQTYGPFTDIDVFPNVLDYWGPNGMIFLDNAQIFWKARDDSTHTLMFALEDPDATVDQGRLTSRIELEAISPRFPAPDISASYKHKWKSGYVRIAGIVRWIRWDDVRPDSLDLAGGTTGWGVSISSNIAPTKRDLLRLEVSGGRGVENHYNDAPVDVGPVRNFGDRHRPLIGVPLPVWGMVAYLDHDWNDAWRSTIGYSRVAIDNSDAQTPNAFRIGQYATANAIYARSNHVGMGAELQWAHRRNFRDGWKTNDVRL